MAKSKSIGNMYATLSLNDSKFKAGLANAGKKLGEFTKASAKYIAAGAAVGGTVVATVMAKAVNEASNLQESLSKSSVVFGDSAADVQSWAKTAANAFGQSNQQAMEAAATIGNMFKAMGIADQESAKMSKAIVELASDLASFNNTTIDEAIIAINAALRGESEPIRRYGVLLDDATLKAEAFAKGIFDGKGSLAPATRALSAYNVILKQTKTAQGDFARTSDGFANSQRILQAQIANATAGLGQGLLPTIQAITSALKDVDMQGFGEKIGTMIGDFAAEWVSIFTDGTTWNLLILNAELAIAKILQLPGLKQIAMLGEMMANGGQLNPVVSMSDGGNVALIQEEIDRVYSEIARKANEDAIKKDQERRAREAQQPTIDVPTPTPAMPEKAKKQKEPESIVDDYMRRGLSMSKEPGGMQDKILKVQEAIRDILKNAQIQDKQLTW
jgi:hypothetical protein